MEVPAHIKIRGKGGEFQFGLVRCDIDGRTTRYAKEERLEFTFECTDENDPVSGRGWLKLTGKNTAEGEFIFHHSDSSTFTAKRKGTMEY